MTTPTYAQLSDVTQGGPGFAPESYPNRLLTIAAMIASGQNPDGTPGPVGGGGGQPANVVVATNIVTDGVTDNWAAIQPLLTAGTQVLLPVGPIAISQPLVMSGSGIGLKGTVKLQPTPDPGGLLHTPVGSYIVPTVGFTAGAVSPYRTLLYVKGNDANVDTVNFDGGGGGATWTPSSPLDYIVYADSLSSNASADFWMGRSSVQGVISGAGNSASVYISPGTARATVQDCYLNFTGNPSTGLVLSWNSSDGLMINERHKDGTVLFSNAGNMVVVGGHWTGGQPGVQFNSGSSALFVGVMFDSPIGVINHTTGTPASFIGCRFYTQVAGTQTVPIINKTSTGRVSVTGSEVSCGSGHYWGWFANGLSTNDVITGTAAGTAAAHAFGLSTAWFQDGNSPGTFSNNTLNGVPGNFRCWATIAGAWSLTNTSAVLPFDTSITDPYNALNTSTGVFTCPASGRYRVTANICYTTATITPGTSWAAAQLLHATPPGSPTAFAQIGAVPPGVGSNARGGGMYITGDVTCNAGDTLSVSVSANTTYAGDVTAQNTWAIFEYQVGP